MINSMEIIHTHTHTHTIENNAQVQMPPRMNFIFPFKKKKMISEFLLFGKTWIYYDCWVLSSCEEILESAVLLSIFKVWKLWTPNQE